jgi:hypothetical protein
MISFAAAYILTVSDSCAIPGDPRIRLSHPLGHEEVPQVAVRPIIITIRA